MSVETPITPEDLERISRHLPCLDRAAADETAHPNVRAVVAAEVAMFRTALKLLEGRVVTAQDPIDRVRQLLVERDIWIAELCDGTGLDPHRIDAALRGERRLTSTEVARIAEWADVSVYWLLGMTEDRHG